MGFFAVWGLHFVRGCGIFLLFDDDFIGKIDPILAFTTGKLKVEGNIDKALRLKQIIDSKKA